MLDTVLKRHIKLLAERYQHEIVYDKGKILLSSDKNQAVIESHNKHTISLSYNASETVSETLLIEKE